MKLFPVISIRWFFGGKGANQAVAAGRCGANITFLACLGNDDIGQSAKTQLITDKIDTDCIELMMMKPRVLR
ncbi:ribokinase [Proteus mirabilis]|uniref:Ribokinase n=1 Tax=Proteus mirabilis TaxID=584 RepID=A0A2X2BTR7_PROMI|nr:ribokinase [Proteus mirabilis]